MYCFIECKHLVFQTDFYDSGTGYVYCRFLFILRLQKMLFSRMLEHFDTVVWATGSSSFVSVKIMQQYVKVSF